MTPLLPLSSFDHILGPIVIGSLISMALWGITCVQTYNFLTGNSMDARVFKALIVFLCFLNPIAVVVPIWSAIVSFHAIWSGYATHSNTKVHIAATLIENIRETVSGLRAASDLCIAGIQTNSLISTLIVYSVNTGLIVTFKEALIHILYVSAPRIDSFSVLITYIVMPTNLIFLVYLNSYLAVLNARQSLRDELENRSPFPLPVISAGGIGSQTPSHETLPLDQSLSMQDQIDR
ncbi:hypothetical protein D9758_005272 [Tetrapyrgos nigripes]|uniref:DUF6534 domain-containing protein n=1 Tax=Tetrapyrgos nigripes TaxID=182062 RepID=A0A8H5GWT2_9AGAR|nr:hypothetical protein D9758_005272 [Tetrapyrgos nigripes]